LLSPNLHLRTAFRCNGLKHAAAYDSELWAVGINFLSWIFNEKSFFVFWFSRFFCVFFGFLGGGGCLLDINEDVIVLRLMNNHRERHVVQWSDHWVQHELLLERVGVNADGCIGLVWGHLMDLDLIQRALKETHKADRADRHGVAEETGHELLGERHLGIRPKVKGLG